MLLADNGASNTLTLTVASGIVTIIVALIAAWATRAGKQHPDNDPPKGEDDFDDQLIAELRSQIAEWKLESAKKEVEIRRLQRLCYMNNVDYMKSSGGSHRAEAPEADSSN